MDVTQGLTTEAQRAQRGHREYSLHRIAIGYRERFLSIRRFISDRDSS